MIKLITSNIRFNNPEDGVNQWTNRKKFLASCLSSLNADIIATQEGREPQLRELEVLLSGFKLTDSNREWIKERMYPCLFIKKSIDVLESGDFWLSKTPYVAGSKSFDSAFPRLCTWAKVKLKNKELYVFAVHLDHTTDDVRFSQANVLSSEIKSINKNNLPTILMGDFNTHPDSKVYNYLLSDLKLLDPWRSLNKVEEPSFHMFKGFVSSAKRIDWILHSKSLNSEEISLIKEEKDGLYLSDHHPVFSKLKLL